jgi:hypothetical protein
MTASEYLYAAAMTVVIVWLVAEVSVKHSSGNRRFRSGCVFWHTATEKPMWISYRLTDGLHPIC